MWIQWGNGILVGAILLLVIAEFRDVEFRETWVKDRVRLGRNLAFLTASLASLALVKRLGEWLSGSLHPLVQWHVGRVWEVAACFLLAELAGWALHFVKHSNGFLWRFHFQHHRESQYNLWLSTHTHGLEVVTSGLATALLLNLAGFSRGTITLYLLFYTFVKVYQHSAHTYSLGPLDRLIVSPRYHRLHHEVESRCNYSVSLTVFDVLFRTVRWPAAEPILAGGKDTVVELDRAGSRYGVSSQQGLPFGFWAEMSYFLRREDGDPRGSDGAH